jgi:gamma-glutamylcyclotransferase
MPVRYFAYGSNMAEAVMSEKCPRHRLVGIARLPGHRLMFNRRSIRTGTGVADVVPAEGEDMWGVLYELADEDLAALDLKEGHDWAYVRVRLEVECDGTRSLAITYVVKDKEPAEVEPSREYFEGIVAAARQRGLPPDYVECLISASRPWRADSSNEACQQSGGQSGPLG